MKIKVGLTADPHLGVATYGKQNPVTGVNTMVEKFANEMEKTLDRMVERKVKVWIFLGDISHTRTPGNYIRYIITKVAKKARKKGIRLYFMLGNHDQQTGIGTKNNLSEIAELEVEGITVVEEAKLETIYFGASNEDDAGGMANAIQIGFLPWRPKTKEIVEDAKMVLEKIDPKYPAILCGHFSIEGAEVGTEKLFELYGDTVVPIDALRSKNVQYTFLGHIHKRQVLKKLGKIMYVGSMERIDFGERKDDKGSMLFTVDSATKDFDLEFIQGTPQEFVQYNVDLTKGESYKDLDFSKAKNAIVKLKFKCTQEQKRKIDFEYLMDKLKDAAFIADAKFEVEEKEERARNKNIVKDLEITEALRLWLRSQEDLTDEIKKQVLKEGKRLLAEDLA